MTASHSLRQLRTKRQRPSSAETLNENHPHNLHNHHCFPTPCGSDGRTLSASASESSLAMVATVTASSHLVQFYDDETHLYSVLSDFFAPLLRADGDKALGGVMLARPRTIHHLGNCFVLKGYQQSGIGGGGFMSQVGTVYQRGERSVFLLDADKVLAVLVPESQLEVNVFHGLTGELMSQMSSLPSSPSMDARPPGQLVQPIYAYGELVDILCARGQHRQALELEALWNSFLQSNNLSLLCGYKMDSFRDSLDGDVFNQICQSHATVTPTESYSRLTTQDQKLAMVAELQQKARVADEEHRRPKHWSTGNTGESAEQQMRYREQFVETLCHELRNPASAIVANVEILQMGLDLRRSALLRVVGSDGSVSQEDMSALQTQLEGDFCSMDAITACAEHIRAVSDNVLSLSKLEGGKVVLQSLPFDLKSAIVGAIKMFTAMAQKKGIELLNDLPPDNLRVLGDQCKFTQVVVNLVSNAIKFTDTGNITVQLRKLGPLALPSSSDCNSPIMSTPSLFEVAVCDTGRGLSVDERAVLFRRFAQPISVNYAKYGGSGLGLYISKYIVELMGGELNVESKLGMGSKFVFTFQAEEHQELEACHSSPQLLLKDSITSSRMAAEGAPFPQPSYLNNQMAVDNNDIFESCSPTGNTSAMATDRTTQSASYMPHILLIDDDPIILRTVARMLALSYQFPPITISTATNGYEGISKLISASNTGTPVSLVIMDLHMPYLDGVATTKQIRALPTVDDKEVSDASKSIAGVIIIGVSGDHRVETLETARAAGMDECLGKPVPRVMLLEVIEKTAERRKSPLYQMLSGQEEKGDGLRS
ncbi:MAG: hypothetical protein M1839_004809 [Geoglossum umbratile]|nr:MAG: hypothetical protein M1839_004809 [Geoglossum umbratile]